MSTLILERIKKGLVAYEKGVDENQENYKLLYRNGRYIPIKPYAAKHFLFRLIDSLDKKTNGIKEIKAEYDRITLKLDKFDREKGSEFREKLFKDLIIHVNGYESHLNSFPTLDDPAFIMDFENLINGRDYIYMLLPELKTDHDLQDIEQKIEELDKEFKEKYLQIIKIIIKELPFIEQPDEPKELWWHHPSVIIAEQQYDSE